MAWVVWWLRDIHTDDEASWYGILEFVDIIEASCSTTRLVVTRLVVSSCGWRHACTNSNTNMDSMCPPEACREARNYCRLVPPRRFASCMASSSSESSCPWDSAGHPKTRAQPLVALVHFRMAFSGRELGSYWSPVLGHGACKYVSFGDSEVYDSGGLCLTKYDLVLDESMETPIPSICLSAMKKLSVYLWSAKLCSSASSVLKAEAVEQGVSCLLPESSIDGARVAWCHLGRPSL